MKKWHLVIDVAKCENCNNCFLSCKDEHVGNEWPPYASAQPSEGQGWIEVKRKERGEYPLIDVAYLPSTCMHCDDPPCAKAAPEGAVRKREDGIVIIDPEKSKGAKQIVPACPYNAVRWNEAAGAPQKCTLCAHLLDTGWTKTRCAQSCPTGALAVYNCEDGEMERIVEAERLEPYRPALATKPRVYYRNLYRFTRCFIAGSVAYEKDGREECAEGAEVVLSNGKGETIARAKADPFGDFKFDNLEEGSGSYTITLSYAGLAAKKIEVELGGSVSVGTIRLR